MTGLQKTLESWLVHGAGRAYQGHGKLESWILLEGAYSAVGEIGVYKYMCAEAKQFLGHVWQTPEAGTGSDAQNWVRGSIHCELACSGLPGGLPGGGGGCISQY